MKAHGTRHGRWINYCLKQAHKNDVSLRCSHCSVLVRGGRVIAVGRNRDKMGCLGYRGYELKGWHSELDVLHRLDPEVISGAVLYVSGLSRGGNILCSKPCSYCQKYLKQFNLKAIYYSMPDNTYGMMVM